MTYKLAQCSTRDWSLCQRIFLALVVSTWAAGGDRYPARQARVILTSVNSCRVALDNSRRKVSGLTYRFGLMTLVYPKSLSKTMEEELHLLWCLPWYSHTLQARSLRYNLLKCTYFSFILGFVD